jgi:hypothetical protein
LASCNTASAAQEHWIARISTSIHFHLFQTKYPKWGHIFTAAPWRYKSCWKHPVLVNVLSETGNHLFNSERSYFMSRFTGQWFSFAF